MRGLRFKHMLVQTSSTDFDCVSVIISLILYLFNFESSLIKLSGTNLFWIERSSTYRFPLSRQRLRTQLLCCPTSSVAGTPQSRPIHFERILLELFRRSLREKLNHSKCMQRLSSVRLFRFEIARIINSLCTSLIGCIFSFKFSFTQPIRSNTSLWPCRTHERFVLSILTECAALLTQSIYSVSSIRFNCSPSVTIAFHSAYLCPNH